MFDRALNYPYSAIEGDFLFTDGATIELEDDSFLNSRQAVLAVGSNRSPEQLVRKFGRNETIPVTKARCVIMMFFIRPILHLMDLFLLS